MLSNNVYKYWWDSITKYLICIRYTPIVDYVVNDTHTFHYCPNRLVVFINVFSLFVLSRVYISLA